MGSVVRPVYGGATRIISSLGVTTLEKYTGVTSYVTTISRYENHTPVCLIDTSTSELSGRDTYTFP